MPRVLLPVTAAAGFCGKLAPHFKPWYNGHKRLFCHGLHFYTNFSTHTCMIHGIMGQINGISKNTLYHNNGGIP